MTEHKPTVFLVDDDEAVRDSLGLLMKSVALTSRSYASAGDFLAEYDPDCPGCLILDISMPGMSGMEFRDNELLDRINQALEDDRKNRDSLVEREEVEKRIEKLTPREKQVLELVVQGKANKVIAGDLEVSQRTVEIHRARVMEKMQARSLAQLVRMVMKKQQ